MPLAACRSTERGEAAKREILAAVPHANVRVMKLDLQDLSSIQKFTNEFNEDAGRLDVLLNNAGIMGTPYGVTRDGFEAQIGTNHLGHFALTGRLLSALKRTPRSRVVTAAAYENILGSRRRICDGSENAYGLLSGRWSAHPA